MISILPNVHTTDTCVTGGSSKITSQLPSGSTQPQRINANDVIVTATRQFVTQEEKNALTNMLDAITGTAGKVMYKETYDRDSDGIVDFAETAQTANSVLWESIIGKPNISAIELEETFGNMHSHDNISDLNQLSFNNITKNLMYGDNVAVNLDSYMSKNDYDIDNDGIVDHALHADSTDWENIINKPLMFTPSEHSHRSSEIAGPLNATSLNGKPASEFLTKEDKITLSQIEDLNGLNISVTEINGGTAGSTYEDVTTKEATIQMRHDTDEYWHHVNPILKLCEIGYDTDTFRYKIGDGFTKWEFLPYEYNTLESTRFNIAARKFLTKYYSPTENVATVDLVGIDEITASFDELYSDTVRCSDGSFIGVPFSATNILHVSSDLSTVNTFGDALETINSSGAGWYAGVSYGDYVYCAPYNGESVLVIDVANQNLDIISDYNLDASTVNKYMRGTYCPVDNHIYFAPYNSSRILEINPKDNTLKFYTDSNIFEDAAGNCCDVVFNPVDNNLYFIPMHGDKIIQFNPITKSMKVVAELRDKDIDKFSCALLAPNGLIYCIPSYGYDYIVVFDPNIYTVKYVPFNTQAYDNFRNAIYAPNNCIYMIPSGATTRYISEYDIVRDTSEALYEITKATNKWAGGVLSEDGMITCLPFTSGNILRINTQLTKPIDSDVLKVFSN